MTRPVALAFLRRAILIEAAVTVLVAGPVRTVDAQESVPVVTGSSFVPGTRELFSTNFTADKLGEFPTGLRYLRGPMDVVERGGVRGLRSVGPAEFIIPLTEVLPDKFTLEFDLVARSSDCCSGEELAFEGTPTLDRGDQSAQVVWHHSYSAIMGGGRDIGNSTVKTPVSLEPTLLGKLVRIQVSFDGNAFKLFANNVQLQNVPSVLFYRAAILRVFLGGVDDGTAAVYLSRVRVAASGTPAPPPPAPTAAAGASPPVGAGLKPVPAPLAAGTPVDVVIDNTKFTARLVQGGSAVADVVSIQMASGTGVNKQLGGLVYEPFVLDVPPGSPMQAWINSALSGAAVRKNGSIFGGIVPAGQQLEFRDGLISAVALPAFDGASSEAGYIRVTITPEEVRQTAATAAATTGPAAVARGGIPARNQWVRSNFRFQLGPLATPNIMQIEPFGATMSVATSVPGELRAAQVVAPKLDVSNLVLTIQDTGTPSVANWLAWYDDFVIKGNNGSDKERTFTLEFLNTSMQVVTTITGSGVGIVTVRRVPNATAAGSSLQVVLYVERLAISP